MRVIAAALTALALAASSQAAVMEDLARPKDYQSCRESSYDRSGGNGDGGQGNPFRKGELRTIADINCPGEISHIWFTLAPFDKDTLGNLILRMYWDGEKSPSVETPLGAFFGLGHGKEYCFDSIPISVGNNRGLNCFFPMPFNHRAKITIENRSAQDLWALYYYIDYKKFDEPRDDILYFHAQYRQAKPALSRENYVALEAQGSGHYVGMFYYIRSNAGGWWGEGDDMIYIDGSSEPVLYGTGMEDYFCNAWGMKHGQAFSRFGAPLFEVYMTGLGNENTAYRWHLEDAVAFRKSIKVTHEHGSNNDRNDDFSSVAFWYQTHPHARFPELPDEFERLSFADKQAHLLENGRYDECRRMLGDFADRAVNVEAKHEALLRIADTYVSQGDRDGARAVLSGYMGPIPVVDWTDRIRERINKLEIQGLTVPDSPLWIVNCGDGRAVLDEIGGAECYRTDRASRSPFLYFRVNNQELRETELDLVLEVECYNTGSGRIMAEYNSAFEGDDVEAKYRDTHVVKLSGEKGWTTVRIDMPRALLVGCQNCSSDLRVTDLDGDIYVRRVGISKK